jgi:hypothetical protein
MQLFAQVIALLAVIAVAAAGTLRPPAQATEELATLEVFVGDKLIYYRDNQNMENIELPNKLKAEPGPIVQIGEKAWQLVKNNEAVVDYSEDWAGAVPQEYEDDWTSLYGWEDMKSEEFRFHYKVGGDTVSELKWKYTWSAKGKDSNGVGQYIMNGGCTIEKLYARVGQTLNSQVSSRSPLNYGTPDNPIAGIDIELSFTSASAFNSETTTCTVTIRGDKDYKIKECHGNDP